jgi:ABC-type Fe3+-hydroxamate transport system substrate-binding protein
LAKRHPIWISDIKDFGDAINIIDELGNLLSKPKVSSILKNEILDNRSSFSEKKYDLKKVIYVIWKDPYMVAGSDTFINSMLKEAGFLNLIEENRYPEIDLSTIKDLNPDLILLSSEPFPFKEKHIKILDDLLPKIPKILVDGEFFSWYGSRMKDAFHYFLSLRENLLQNVFVR